MDDLLSEFLTESAESLATLDVELVKLEQNPEPKLISSIFRLVHTIKGTCGFIGLPRLETLAHSAENVLGKIRDGKLPVSSQAISLILASIDRIKMILSVIEKTEAEPAGTDADLIEQLNAMFNGDAVATEAAAVAEPVAVVEPPPALEPKAEPAPTAATAAPNGSTYEHLGGAIAIEAAIELFFAKAMHDASLAAHFAKADIATIKKQQMAYLAGALGGPTDSIASAPNDLPIGIENLVIGGETVEVDVGAHLGAHLAEADNTLDDFLDRTGDPFLERNSVVLGIRASGA